MIFLIVIELLWVFFLLISGDLFDAPGAPDPTDPTEPPERTYEDFLKSFDPDDRHRVRFNNPDYDPTRGFHPHTNNPYYYPFRNYEDEDPKDRPRLRLRNVYYDPQKEFHPDTNNPYHYPFKEYKEEDPNKVSKLDFLKKKMKVLLVCGVGCVLVAGIIITLPIPADFVMEEFFICL
jgi:hypothetical protein